MKPSNRRFSLGQLMMAFSMICFCLVLISTSMMSGLYARYITRGTGSDSGRVIKFHQLNVIETGDFKKLASGENQFIFIPGVPLEKNVKISFGGSEALTIVFVSVEASGWKMTNKVNFLDAQEQLSWSVADQWTYLKSNGNQHTYYIVLNPNQVLTETEFIKNNTVNVSSDGTVSMYQNYSPTNFVIKAYAVQANGFETVAEAWESLNN